MAQIKLLLPGFVVGAVALGLHLVILNHYGFKDIGLWKFYGYFAFYFVLLIFYLHKISKKNPDRIGLNFIALLLVKLFAFSLIFYQVMMNLSKLGLVSKLQVLLPFLIFLVFETWAVSKLLKINSN